MQVDEHNYMDLFMVKIQESIMTCTPSSNCSVQMFKCQVQFASQNLNMSEFTFFYTLFGSLITFLIAMQKKKLHQNGLPYHILALITLVLLNAI